MRIYIVFGISQGIVSEVKGFMDPSEAEAELLMLQSEDPETDAQLHEIDVDARPVSVIIRRQIW